MRSNVTDKCIDNPVLHLGLVQKPAIKFVFIVNSLPDQADGLVPLFRYLNGTRPAAADHGNVQSNQGAVRVDVGREKLAG